MFAHQLDEYYEDPVLIIKTAWGGKSLAEDFRPPSAGGNTGEFYNTMIQKVKEVTQNLGTEFPDLSAQDFEISGFAWFQGWNDGASDAFLNEYDLLKDPVIYVHPLCPVTTPFDVANNRVSEKTKKHGSVGMGFGATIQRQENFYKLFVQDLYFETVLVAKLRAIANYYQIENCENEIDYFLECAKEAREIIQLSDDRILKHSNPIFEGAQGILLDMDFGFFPNVTRSNTTTKNALQIHQANEVYYVTRSYLTRHGSGFLPNEQLLNLKNNQNETNKSHEFQGEFRTAELNIDLLKLGRLLILLDDLGRNDLDYNRVYLIIGQVYTGNTILPGEK